jgi:plasmid stabilization system protein ParE
MVKVRMAGPARAYLRKEASYLRQYSPQAADAFLRRMREAREHLTRFPLMGFEKSGLPVPGVRSLVVGTYNIDYEITGDDLLIVSIRPGQVPEPSVEVDDNFDYEGDGSRPRGSERR